MDQEIAQDSVPLDVGTRRPVYVIDPDAGVRRSLTTLLGTYDLDVVQCRSAEEFLARPERGEGGCLITEIDLPGMSGLELHELLRQEGGGWRVIFLSSTARASTIVQAIRSGAIDFIQKPDLSAGLITTVRDAMGLVCNGMKPHNACG